MTIMIMIMIFLYNRATFIITYVEGRDFEVATHL